MAFRRLKRVPLCLFFLAAFHAEVQAEDPFDWQSIPDSAVLKPARPFTSDLFNLVDSSDTRIRVAFHWPKGDKQPAKMEDRFRFILVTPKSGIRSATFASSATVYLINGARVEPATAPNEPPLSDRLSHRTLGKYRGAEIVLVEFHPLISLRGSLEANASWISHATLTLNLATPFGPERPVGKVPQEAFSSLALNGADLSRCLSPLAEGAVLDAATLERWQTPTLKIRTRGEGWFKIDARRLLGEWGRSLSIKDLRLSQRAPLIESPHAKRLVEDSRLIRDVEETLFVLDASGGLKGSGMLTSEDQLFFHASLSRCPSDPLACYWLSYEKGSGSEKGTEKAPAGEALSAGLPAIATGWARSTVGLDREFVEGGLKNEKQAAFWVDRAFPSDQSSPLSIALPEWLRSCTKPVNCTVHLLSGSTSKDKYLPEDRLKQGDIALMIGGATVSSALRRSADNIGTSVSIALRPEMGGATLCVFHRPKQPARKSLYFDEMTVEGVCPLVWSGTDAAYSWQRPVTGRVIVRDSAPGQNRQSASASLPAAFGKSASGTWTALFPQLSEGSLIVAATSPIMELQLISKASWKSAESLSRYSLPSWLSEPPSADQLVITPAVFSQEADLLCEGGKRQGYSYRRIDLEGIFDLFGGGQFSPHALKDFLSWVARTWPDPQPYSVLLVGDSSWDSWGRFPTSSQVPNWTPSYHTETHPDYPSDHWFVEGEPGDRVADWFWGRLPCQTAAQLQSYLGKSERSRVEFAKDAMRRMIWVIDDNPPFEKSTTEIVREVLPLNMRLDPIRVCDFPFVDNFYYGAHLAQIQAEARKSPDPLDYGKISPECNQAIRNSLDKGAALFVYYGHSGLNVLAHERVLFGGGSKFSDIPTLKNGGKCPLAFLMTCDVGRFDYAENPKWSVGLAEEMLFHGRGGCLALVTSTGRGMPDDHLLLLQGCMDTLFVDGVRASGAVEWAGKVQTLIPGRQVEGIDMFTLLGDPLFAPPIPAPLRPVPKRLRWNRNGSLDVDLDLSAWGAQATQVFSAWQMGGDLREVRSWNAPTISEEDVMALSLPDGRDLQTLMLGISARQESRTGEFEFTAGGAAVELAGFARPDWTALAGTGLPNLVLDDDHLMFENYSPQQGESIFLRATIRNEGAGAAENIEVRAYEGDNPAPLTDFAHFPEAVIRRLQPGEEGTVRLRWDGWDGTGEYTITVKVDPGNKITESSKDDNHAEKTIRILGKADLAWGLVHDSTAGRVDFSRARTVPAGWITNPTTANLGPFSSLRALLAAADRAVMIEVPLCNFGETKSTTCAVQISYFKGGMKTPLIEPIILRIQPLPPSLHEPHPRSVRLPLLPEADEVVLLVDPDSTVDEVTRDNNRLRIDIPNPFWEGYPSLKPKRVPPKALERFERERR